MEDAIASTLSHLIGVLDREYSNENTYHISLITYALTLASQRPGATTEVQDAAHRAFQYLQDLAHEGGKTCCSSFNSVSLATFYQLKMNVYFCLVSIDSLLVAVGSRGSRPRSDFLWLVLPSHTYQLN